MTEVERESEERTRYLETPSTVNEPNFTNHGKDPRKRPKVSRSSVTFPLKMPLPIEFKLKINDTVG